MKYAHIIVPSKNSGDEDSKDGDYSSQIALNIILNKVRDKIQEMNQEE